MVLFCGEIITNLLLELLIIVVTEHWDLIFFLNFIYFNVILFYFAVSLCSIIHIVLWCTLLI